MKNSHKKNLHIVELLRTQKDSYLKTAGKMLIFRFGETNNLASLKIGQTFLYT